MTGNQKDFLTCKEVASQLGVCPQTIYSLVASGRLPAHRFGIGRGAIRISSTDVNRFLESCRTQGCAPVDAKKTVRRIRPKPLKHLKRPK